MEKNIPVTRMISPMSPFAAKISFEKMFEENAKKSLNKNKRSFVKKAKKESYLRNANQSCFELLPFQKNLGDN